MAGKRYGMLTVLKYAGTTPRGLALWECKCDCGRIVIHPGTVLRGERVYSCGCAKRPKDAPPVPNNGIRYGLTYLKDALVEAATADLTAKDALGEDRQKEAP
jgi:hypothetical protein